MCEQYFLCSVCRLLLYCFFFFKQKTAYEMRISDWSSDVCSSDLTTASRDHDIAEIAYVGGLSGNTNKDLLSAALDIARAAVGIVAFQGVDHIGKRQAKRRKLHRIGGHMILPFIATDRIDLGHPGYRAQLRPHHPVRKGTQVGWRPFAPVRLARSRLGLDGEHEDLAEPCRDRPHLGLDAFGKLAFHLLNAFVDELAREIDVGSVLKHDGHLAEAIARNRES